MVPLDSCDVWRCQVCQVPDISSVEVMNRASEVLERNILALKSEKLNFPTTFWLFLLAFLHFGSQADVRNWFTKRHQIQILALSLQ
jgi:hypothetical protein